MKRVFVFGLFLAVAACGGDEIVINAPGTGSGSGTGEGTGGGTPEPTPLLPTTDNSTSCNQLIRTTLVDQACDSNLACGAGGRCVTQSTPEAAACAQICFPDQGCETCNPDESCVRLLTDNGEPVRFDLDSDGTAETVAGACQTRVVAGPQGAFDPCGLDVGACAEGYTCIQREGRSTGTCFEVCEAACNPFEGELPVCSGTSTGQDVCLFACNDGECPGDLACVEVANGNSACMR